MTFIGYLSEFTLPEIFHLLQQAHKTGLLTIRTLPATLGQQAQAYYIWLHQGRIVATANRLDNQGLVLKIAQRGWVSERVALRIFQICPANTPMGLCLKLHGLLQAEQLKLLFRTQVLELVCALFQLKDGEFEFDTKAALPSAEMTGLSVPGTEVTLMALRSLRDWTPLSEKLPEPTSGLMSTIIGQPQLRLDSLEWQVWEYVNSTVSLQTISHQLGLSVEKVQQVAFRLITANIAEEVFLITAARTTPMEEMATVTGNSLQPSVSQSFLQNLMGFLRQTIGSKGLLSFPS